MKSNQKSLINPEALMLIVLDIMQVKTFKPQLVAVRNESLVSELKEALADCEDKPEIIPGEQGVIEVVYCLLPLFCLADKNH